MNDLSEFAAVLLDLDGTIYHEEHPLPGAQALVRSLQDRKIKFACLSNSGASPVQITGRLAGMGLQIDPDHIYTAAAATADYVLTTLARNVMPGESHGTDDEPRRPRIFNCATGGIQEMLEGLVDWVQTGGEPCDAVIAASPVAQYSGEARQRIALQLLRNGARLIGICADRVYPSPRGLEFGAGSASWMLAYAANVKPFFCGKPEPIFFHELCNRLQVTPDRCLLVGDNLESDVAGARPLGMKTILTLTGVTRRRDLLHLSPEKKPDRVIEDLLELLGDEKGEPLPPARP
jgi:NagD protein